MRIVVTIGGSILIQDNDYRIFKDYVDVLKEMKAENELFVVVGGGRPARDYIAIARGLGASEALCDDVGIDVTRLNARLLIMALGMLPTRRCPIISPRHWNTLPPGNWW